MVFAPTLCAIEDSFAQLGKERGAGPKRGDTRCKVLEKLVEAIDRLKGKFKALKLQMANREAEKKVDWPAYSPAKEVDKPSRGTTVYTQIQTTQRPPPERNNGSVVNRKNSRCFSCYHLAPRYGILCGGGRRMKDTPD
ncbi:hypothetical protein BGY98DRAFT_933333 [Russula aff. rugulosa BPL654]|nr:hypothetical protein BGY98DRAFT_933333 [Russula aff. rugulosa BPL654]